MTIAAENYRGLLRALDAKHSGLGEAAAAFAIAIDGNIVQEPMLETLEPDSEVVFLPRIEGG